MTPGRPPVTVPRPTKTLLREPDGAAGGDFSWPPPADDPAMCSIVLIAPEADQPPRPRPIARDDEPMEAFPEIDIETALDAFADVPAPSALPVMREAWRRDRPVARPPVPRRRAGMRSLVALCIGASLALMPPPRLSKVYGAPPPDVPAKAQPQGAGAPAIRTPDGPRVLPEPATDPRAGRLAPRDEDRIRTTLTELRNAYSQLDADAAREVWPSVDVTGLARAFDDLKFQDLRFDHCDVSVDGARARAACTGEAVYVPRVGNAASSRASRAWTFELTRVRERWMIASARAI